jgi:cardiolipin synthase
VGTSCSSLPDVRQLIRCYPRTHALPAVAGEQGTLDRESAARVLEELRGGPQASDIIDRYLTLMEAVGASPPVTGNRAMLLIDGDVTFAAMLKAMQDARDHINFETYIIRDDEVGNMFADLLIKKSREGLAVNLIYDGFGSKGTPRSFFDRLEEGGVKVVEYNPMRHFKMGRREKFYNRTHRKTLIVDGAIAFTGGINIGNAYLKSRSKLDKVSPPEEFWRDTQVMIEGPAARDFQRLFIETWQKQKGPPLAPADYYPAVGKKGDDIVQVVASSKGYCNRTTYTMYVSAIANASKSVHITQSYFAPDDQMLEALMQAAQRGVDVRIILPEHTDHGVVRQAARWHYTRLLKTGVKLYERAATVLHAKAAVIDGVWSTVGSTNLELWSFVSNDEINAVVLGRTFAKDMERAFQDDLEDSNEVLLGEWTRRPLFDRAKEFFFHLFRYWL